MSAKHHLYQRTREPRNIERLDEGRKDERKEIRYILQFFFDQGEKAAKAAERINLLDGPDTVNEHVAQKWFARFRSGNFEVKDAPRVGRPVVENCDKIMEIVETDRHMSTWNHLHNRTNPKKHDGPNFHLRIVAESQQNRSVSEAFGGWQ